MCRFAARGQERPVLILTRDSALDYLTSATVAPITGTIRGTPSEVHLGPEDGLRRLCAANLHHAVTVDQRKLGRRVAQLSPGRVREACAALRFSLGCD
jgi:mRNA-degrading endonuclease toxin of MazEF toxin-antitoxin module